MQFLNPSSILRQSAFACVIAAASSVPAGAEPTKIYLMAGRSNMEGWGHWLDNNDNPHPSLIDPTDHYPLTQGDVDAYSIPLNQVWVSHPEGNLPTGPLMPGFGAGHNNGTEIGIELSMGHDLAAANTNPFYFLKSDKGGTALGSAWLPPSSAALSGSPIGAQYTRAIRGFHELLADFDNNPLNNGEGYEIAGFVWLQGWNDYGNASFVADYEQNLLNLVRDVRTDLGVPDLPVILSDSPRDVSVQSHNDVAAAKLAVANTLNAELPGSAVYVDSLGVDPDGGGGWFHWNYTASNYIEMGKRNAAGAQAVMRTAPVNHESDQAVAAAWDGFRDSYYRKVRYEMEVPAGTAVANTTDA